MPPISGSPNDDTLAGTSNADTLFGLAGNDTLFGSALGDSMDGGADTDTVDYSASAAGVTANLQTGTGTNGDAAGDILVSIENLIGSNGADVLTGNGGDNRLEGLGGDNTLSGGLGHDTLIGGSGNDWLDGGTGNDIIDGGAGTNTVDYSGSASGVRVNLFTGTTTGGYGIDTLSNISNIIGSDFNDSLTGDSNDNILVGSAGRDTLVGGLGFDTADYSSAGAAVKVSLLAGSVGVGDVAIGDILGGIEALVGSGFGDSLTGDAGDNKLYGLDGNDSLLGGLGNDTIDGGLGSNDSMTGGAGDDVYFVDATSDRVVEAATAGTDLVFSSATFALGLGVENLVLTGTASNDATGNSVANVLTGNTGDNSLAGGAGNDALIGDLGNDTLNGGAGTDSMTGGNGDDTYSVDTILDTIDEVGSTGHDTVLSTVVWTLADELEDLTQLGISSVAATGNASDNVINGNIGSNVLTGLGGDDMIVGDLTDDTLKGGNDTLNGGSGANTLVGGLGNDTYILTTGLDFVIEDADGGTDTVQTDHSYISDQNVENLVLLGTDDLMAAGNELANVITGNTGNNALFGEAGNDSISGGIGNDTFTGGTGDDSAVGGLGDDTYFIEDTGDVAIEGALGGTDEVFTFVDFTLGSNVENITALSILGVELTGNTLNNVMTGDDGGDVLNGSAGNDTMTGGFGNDTLVGGVGIDSMSGGGDDDTYVVLEATDILVEDASSGDDLVQSAVSWTLGDNFEDLTLTGATGLSGTGNIDANMITGTIGANLLTGLGGADSLVGDLGNDTLIGGAGNDTMVGGGGNDTYGLSSAADVLVETADNGTDVVKVDFTYQLADNFEVLTMSGSGAIDGTGNSAANILNGNSGANILSGLGGDDTISGGDGDDEIDGGLGADSMSGGTGADSYVVDDVGDKIIETSARQIDDVTSTVTYTLAVNVENLLLVGGALNGTGNSSGNILTGTASSNVLTGLAGNDTMSGDAGADTLDGGTGNDNMVGGNGNDTYIVGSFQDIVDEATTTGRDLVQSSVSLTLGTNVEDLTLTGLNKLNAVGNVANNTITGNSAANNITGLEGNDTLTGDLGADHFIFTSGVNGQDTITDFDGLISGVAEGDVLQLAVSMLVGVFEYVGAAGFSGGSDNSEARINNGRVLIDTNGDGGADLTIVLTGLVSEDQLSAANFAFI